MKKVLLLFAILPLMFSTPTKAANYQIQSFLNPNVSSIIVSNNIGVTNLNYIAQNLLQGVYQLGTNNAGTSINAAIATNWCASFPFMFSNATPVSWYGQQYSASWVIMTNASAIASSLSTNDVLYYLPATNTYPANLNCFADVILPTDNNLTAPVFGIGAAGQTNAVGMLQIVSQQFTQYGYGTGAGSNIVNLSFVGLPNPPSSANPSGFLGSNIPGYTAGLEPTDGAVSGGAGVNLFTVTYTNQISTVGAPTVVQVPVPLWKFAGDRALRLRWVYTGSSTNAIAINSITFSDWTP